MIKTNFFTYSSAIILEFLGKILYFPVWWYSLGLIKRAKSLFYFIKDKEKDLGFSIWLSNIFVPMYGQKDFWGRIISFFVRFFQVLFRGIILLIYLLLAIIMLLFWLLIPLIIFFFLIFQIF